MPIKKWYVGWMNNINNFCMFSSCITPTRESHGHRFAATVGPFRTKRAAIWAAKYGKDNPHFQHVDDAERLCKLGN